MEHYSPAQNMIREWSFITGKGRGVGKLGLGVEVFFSSKDEGVLNFSVGREREG